MKAGPRHRLLAIGLAAACLAVGGVSIVLPFASEVWHAAAEAAAIEARLEAMRQRPMDIAGLRTRKSALEGFASAKGAFVAGAAPDGQRALMAILRAMPGSDPPDVTPLASAREGDFTAVRARYTRRLPAGEVTAAIAGIESAMPLLFTEEVHLRRLRDADPRGDGVELSVVVRAYVDIPSAAVAR